MEKIALKDFLNLSKKTLINKIIIFPTDTVYGVGCLYNDSVGVEKIYQMKKRDYGKPLPVLCSSIEMVSTIGNLRDDMEPYTKCWPGALTIIMNKKNELGTVAIRIPNSEIALKLIDNCGPLYTTSVNYSGEKELNNVIDIEKEFSDYVDYIITDTQVFSKTPSTIISCVDKDMKVIRQGSIYFN